MRLDWSRCKQSLKEVDPAEAYSIKETAFFLGVTDATLYRTRGNKAMRQPKKTHLSYVGEDIINFIHEELVLRENKQASK